MTEHAKRALTGQVKWNAAAHGLTITKRGVMDWAEQWPCSGLRTGGWAQFERNGDLCALSHAWSKSTVDGTALRALLDDAYALAHP